MSLVLPEIIKELEGVAKEWHDGLSRDMKAHSTYTPESGQTLILESINRNTRLWGKLSNVTLRATNAISTPTLESVHEAMSRLMLDGIVQHLGAARLVAFSERCRGLLPPSKAEFTDVSRMRHHEMTFVPSDCFDELSSIYPGAHGWVFIFRNDLKEWLLKTPDPFTVTYQGTEGHNTVFGVYEAMQFPEGNMTGPEFVKLSESTQKTILAQASKDVQKDDHDIMRKALLASHLTVSCFLLQCREKPVPSSIFEQSRPNMTPFFQKPPEIEKVQYSQQIMCSDSSVVSRPSAESMVIGTTWEAPTSQRSAPFHASASTDPGENFTAPVAQAGYSLQEKSDPRTNTAIQAESNTPGPSSAPTLVSNMAVNTSHTHMVPVPGPIPNEHGWYNENAFYNGQGYPPPAYQNHPSKNHQQDQIQFTEAREHLPPRLRTADGRQSASYGIPLRVSTNTRGPALGYMTQSALQPPTLQAPPSNYRTQRIHGNNHNLNQNTDPAWANGGYSRATVVGTHAGRYQQGNLAQPFPNPSLVNRPQFLGNQTHDYRRQVHPGFTGYRLFIAQPARS